MNRILEKMFFYADRAYDAPTHYINNDQVLLADTSFGLVIAPAGSNDWRDWFNNLRVGSTIEHEGIARSAIKIISAIAGDVSKMGRPIYVTGHSRGGAIAQHIAEYYANRGYTVSCITFGAPAIVDRKGRDHYNSLRINHTTVRNGWDIVTYMVPGFRHVGKIVRLKQPFWHRLMFFRVRDHFRASAYKKAIAKYYDGRG